MKRHSIRYFLQLIILFFILLTTVPTFSGCCINSHGMFGEITSSTVIKEIGGEVSDISARLLSRQRQKGINIYNIWFLLRAVAVFIGLAACACQSPRKDSIVARKVRMDE